jgi:hypothetical protein
VSGPLRPKFSEGQILGAADLTAHVDYERLGSVLHERTEHLWGVAQGLALTPKDNQDAANNKYIDVELSPGRAVDQLGRSIVVMAAMPLEPKTFLEQIANPDRNKLYPVYVQAALVDKVGDTQPGKCGITLVTRQEESVQVSFGNPGSEIAVFDRELVTVDQGFGKQTLNDKVLVGWVQFDPKISNNEGRFTALATQANGVSVRYVGVVASDVVAGGGTLTLHTRPSGQRFMVSIAENPQGGCVLAFGKQTGTDPIVPVFTVDDKGNVRFEGALSPSPIAKTLAGSGLAFDGGKLPLPSGVTQPDVDDDKVLLHMSVTPLPLQPTSMTMPDNTIVEAIPLIECSVDPDTRIVRSVVRWADPTKAASNYFEEPNPCRYVIIASGV